MMLRLVTITSAAAVAMVFAMAQPSFATDARQAIKLCDKNPNCNYDVLDNGDVNITVGGNLIYCPQEGQCRCDICNHPQRKNTKLQGPRAVPTVLAPG